MENLYKTLLNISSEGIVIHDKGLIVEANLASVNILGYESIEELLGEQILDMHFTENAKNKIREHITDEEATYQVEIIKVDNSINTIEITSKFVSYKGEKLRVALFKDVSLELKKLFESEEKYKALFMSASDAALLYKDHKIIECNERALKILKGSREDIIGLTPWDISPINQSDGSNSKEKALRNILSAKKGKAEEFEWLHKNLKNELLDIEVTISVLDEKTNYYLGTWKDITEKREAEQKIEKYYEELEHLVKLRTEQLSDSNIKLLESETTLRKRELFFRSIFNKSNDGITIADENGNYKFVNPAFVKLSGYTEKELLKMKVFDLTAQNQIEEQVYHDFIIGKTKKKDVLLQKKNQEVFIAEIRGDTLNLDNEILVLGVIRDMTEQRNEEKKLKESKKKQLELYFKLNKTHKELSKQKENLEKTQEQLIQSEKMASIGLLSAGIAHEINNPINYISGGIAGLQKTYIKLVNSTVTYGEIVQQIDFEEDINIIVPDRNQINDLISTSNELFECIHEGIKRTTNIVHSMQAFSSNFENQFENININDTIDSILDILYNSHKNRIVIKKDFIEDPIIEGLQGKLQQVFLNILSNAIQSIHEKGEIFIKTRWNTKRDKLIISFKDSGIGILDKHKKKIFDPFFTTKDVGKGMGLGLYLTYTYIEQHSGVIKVNSQLGKGAEFIIEIPKLQH
jgi:PAS domain S-box-containing protein